MSAKFKAPRGTFDLLPEQAAVYERIGDEARGVFERAGYGRIETPAFEETELFARGVGETTDIVTKEMFTFEDKGGRSLTLRPEGTAPICRAYVEHGMHKLPQPVRLWYAGPFFRHERPQAGRYRQFSQIGAEAIGSDDPLVDAESIVLLEELMTALEIPDRRLKLSSLGSTAARQEYLDELRSYLRSREGELSKEVRGRLDANPLRAFDADDEGTRAVMAEAPKLLERLPDDDAEHLAEVRRLLDSAGVGYELDPTLVRGLDYYTRTVFEIDCERLGAQSQVGGGGRYDGLVEQLGGPPTAGIGWAVGVERISLALGEKPAGTRRDVFIAGDADRARVLALLGELRRAGLSAEADLAGRSMKGQMKQAGRSGARYALILEGGGKPQLRDMESGEQRGVDPDQVVELVREGAG